MKKITAGLLLLVIHGIVIAQRKSVVDHAVEGGKVLVDLIKVFSTERQAAGDTDCPDDYADLCITNSRDSSLTVAITHRASNEIRELIILPDSRECSLQLDAGVWTYTIRQRGSPAAMRKGDLLAEPCQNLEMKIK